MIIDGFVLNVAVVVIQSNTQHAYESQRQRLSSCVCVGVSCACSSSRFVVPQSFSLCAGEHWYIFMKNAFGFFHNFTNKNQLFFTLPFAFQIIRRMNGNSSLICSFVVYEFNKKEKWIQNHVSSFDTMTRMKCHSICNRRAFVFLNSVHVTFAWFHCCKSFDFFTCSNYDALHRMLLHSKLNCNRRRYGVDSNNFTIYPIGARCSATEPIILLNKITWKKDTRRGNYWVILVHHIFFPAVILFCFIWIPISLN